MKVRITDDFDLDKIDESGQCFRVKRYEDDEYRFIFRDKILHIKKVNDNEYYVNSSREEWKSVWEPYFDMSRNYSEIRELIDKDDDYLKAASCDGKGIRILKQDPFEMLLTFIISQRKNIPAIKKSVELICQKFGERAEDEDEEVFLFPDPLKMRDITVDDLKGLSLGYRDEYIVDAVRMVNSGELLPDELYTLSDEDLFEALKRVKGVGNKVSNCICLFAYGRTGMVPVDTWIAKVIKEVYNGVDPFFKYGDNAGIMQQWIFYHARKAE
ncbi:MAG: DNA-3-methyladenine glycosylase 2 family protein [Lachnospiraceae bacterium]|nr:DNA-3-methyladenine glycosylase 2 family protein [Lachnospiraceae bacterium]